jgi:hypothetical protein
MSTSASAGMQTSAGAGPGGVVPAGFARRREGRSSPPGTQGAYARVDPQTLIHYQLLLAPATASPALLELYPFSVLRNDGHLGIVLPTPPRDADLRSAFRLAADLGRRAAGVEVQPEIVASGADGWLHAGGSPAIVLGTTDRLPQAAEMLRRTGFVQSGGGWTAPGGETVTREDGLLVAGTSPWDGQSAILLVSGQTDEAVTAAAATIASAGQPAPAGRYAIVRRGPRAVRVEPSAAGRLTIGNFDEGIEARGPGSRAQSVSFSAPPVGSEGIGSLRLKLSQNTSQAGTSSIWVRVNGVLAGSSILSGARQDGVLRLPVSGSILKPGLNSLTIGLDLAGPPDTWARVSPGAELVLPRPPADVRLELLPDPLFRDPGGVLVVLGGRSDAILGAAARVLTALGGRTTALPILDVADAATVAPSRLSRSAVIAIGAHDNAHGLLNRLGQLMPHPAGGEGVVELRPMVASTSHAMLWIDGGSPDLLAMPAAALARHPLPGVAISVDGAGRVRAISEAGTPLAGDPLPLVLSRVLIVTACAAVVLLLSWQVVWPREVNV